MSYATPSVTGIRIIKKVSMIRKNLEDSSILQKFFLRINVQCNIIYL